MKKLVNDPLLVVEDMIEGLLRADDQLTCIANENVVLRRDYRALADSGKVAIISGGGAGHEPAHAGYVGEGMLTAAVVGAVFTSPSVDAVLAAIRAVAGPAGVLLIIKNYTGDRLNFGLAAEIARAEGVVVEMVIVGDDVALDDDGGRVGRRGLAGTVLVHKVAGAAAAAGLSLEQVKAEGEAAAAALYTMGLGLGTCIVPASGKRGFELGEDEVEYGLGIHGESGAGRDAVTQADAMIDRLLDRLLERSGLVAGDEVVMLVNNLGGTAVQELNIAARRALVRLDDLGVKSRKVWQGSFLTALEMPGVSISLLKLEGDRLSRLLSPTRAAAWARPSTPALAVETISAEAPASVGEAWGSRWRDEKNAARFGRAIANVIDALKDAEAELTELDSVVGDGDMGISLARGARSVEEVLAQLDLTHPAATLAEIASTLRRSLGGSSGPLYAAFILRIAAQLAEAEEPDEPTAWTRAFRSGCDAMQDLGGAEAGDRTMLDALLPAAQAMEDAATGGATGAGVIEAAVEAAQAGVLATRQMMPRLGRSSYIGSRALGHPDPGAHSVALWLRAIADAMT